MYFILALFVPVWLLSCSGSSDDVSPPPAVTKWEMQLQHSQSLSAPNGYDQLLLVGYKSLGKVKSDAEKELLVDELFSDDAYTIFAHSADSKLFDIVTWGDYRKVCEHGGLNVRTDVLSHIEIGRTEVIEIEWSYRGNTYRTKALSDDDNGIFFDNIATYVPYYGAVDSDTSEPAVTNVTRMGRLYLLRSRIENIIGLAGYSGSTR